MGPTPEVCGWERRACSLYRPALFRTIATILIPGLPLLRWGPTFGVSSFGSVAARHNCKRIVGRGPFFYLGPVTSVQPESFAQGRPC